MKSVILLYLLILVVFSQIQKSYSASIKIIHLKKAIENLLLDSEVITDDKINLVNLLIQFIEKYLFSENSVLFAEPLTKFKKGILEDFRKKLQQLKLKFNLHQKLFDGHLNKGQHLNVVINQPNWVLSEMIKTKQLKNKEIIEKNVLPVI